jgi:phosphatidylglycerol:prolipoprotein diacylglycerol transferase
LWNLVGLLLILLIVSKGRRFDGENTWFYFLWYGIGRSWIEGLRTDSLYLFDWTIFGQAIRVSQLLSVVLAAVAAFMLFYNIKIKQRTPEGLLVNQLAAQAEAVAEAPADIETTEAPEAEQVEAPAETAAPAEETAEPSPVETEEEVKTDGPEN